MKKLLSVLMALVMCFGVFSGALAEIVVVPASGRLDENTEYEMIETDLPSGIYDDGRTLIIHPDDGNMLFDYDPEAASSGGMKSGASAADLDAALNIYGADLEFNNTVSSYPWEVAQIDGRFCARSTSQSGRNSHSSFTVTVDCRAGEKLSFDYCVKNEANSDYYLYVYLDGSSILEYVYDHPAWGTYSRVLSSGAHVVKFDFYTSYSTSSYYACVDNIKVTSSTISDPMILPSDFDSMLDVHDNGFLADIEPPVDGAIAVSDAKQLYDIRNNPQGNYFLTCDIDISELENWGLAWSSIPSYSGIFDGQGHSIGILTDCLFDQATGTIKNLSAEVNISGGFIYAGAFVEQASGRISFENCVVKGSITSFRNNDVYVGGMIGYCNQDAAVLFDNCHNMAAISASSTNSFAYAGGMIGYSYSYYNYSITCINCRNEGNISCEGKSKSYAGGMVGIQSYNNYATATFTNCINTGSVTVTANASLSYSGGLIGYAPNTSTYTNCVNTADVVSNSISTSYSGGMAGYAPNSVSLSNCYIDGEICSHSDGANAYSGGIAGYCSKEFTSDKARIVTNGIRAESEAENTYAYVGGIVGFANTNASIGYCLTDTVDGSAYDSWHVMKGSVAGYVVNTLTLNETCAYNDLNNFAGYYGTLVGRENAVPYTGDPIVRNANYTIKIVDSGTGAAIPNAQINCDGYKMNTDANGMARLTLPVNVMIQITVSKSLYAPTTVFAEKLSTNGINTFTLRYVGTGPSYTDPTSGSGSGGSGGGSWNGSVNSGGHTVTFPGTSSPKVMATGPNTTLHGKTTPALKLELGFSLPIFSLKAKYDCEKQILKIMVNVKFEMEMGDEGFEHGFENKFKTLLMQLRP